MTFRVIELEGISQALSRTNEQIQIHEIPQILSSSSLPSPSGYSTGQPNISRFASPLSFLLYGTLYHSLYISCFHCFTISSRMDFFVVSINFGPPSPTRLHEH